MQCPKCKKEGCRYVEQKERKSTVKKKSGGRGTIDIRYYEPRTNFQATHNCGFKGET